MSTRNFGISSTTPGTASTASTVPATSARPRKRSRASAYPAMLSKISRPRVTEMVTTKLLVNQRPSGTGTVGSPPKAVFQADRSTGFGISASGWAAASASVLNEVASWITNGPR